MLNKYKSSKIDNETDRLILSDKDNEKLLKKISELWNGEPASNAWIDSIDGSISVTIGKEKGIDGGYIEDYKI